jgi:hypothetical protein
MFTRIAAVIHLSVAVASPALLLGQAPTAVPGSRVRLRTITGATVEGRLLTLAADSLTIQGEGGPISMPRASVHSLETWSGRGSQWRSGAEIGSFVGFATASVVFAARMRHCVGVACAKSPSWVTYGWAGALPGALVGGLVGALVHHDQWERAPLGPVHPQIAIQAGDQGIGVSIRF